MGSQAGGDRSARIPTMLRGGKKSTPPAADFCACDSSGRSTLEFANSQQTGTSRLAECTGADSLFGRDGDDILLSGTTTYFAESTGVLDRPALEALMAEWIRTDVGYDTRGARLWNGGGLNGEYRLSSTTVLSDGTAVDTLAGGDDLDWFRRFGNDLIRDFGHGGSETEK